MFLKRAPETKSFNGSGDLSACFLAHAILFCYNFLMVDFLEFSHFVTSSEVFLRLKINNHLVD